MLHCDWEISIDGFCKSESQNQSESKWGKLYTASLHPNWLMQIHVIAESGKRNTNGNLLVKLYILLERWNLWAKYPAGVTSLPSVKRSWPHLPTPYPYLERQSYGQATCTVWTMIIFRLFSVHHLLNLLLHLSQAICIGLLFLCQIFFSCWSPRKHWP